MTTHDLQEDFAMPVLNRCLALVACACALAALAAPASAQLLQRKDLSYSMALTIAQGTIAECQKRGFAVSVVVVDRGGEIMVALRDDNAGPHTPARPAKVGTGFASGRAVEC